MDKQNEKNKYITLPELYLVIDQILGMYGYYNSLENVLNSYFDNQIVTTRTISPSNFKNLQYTLQQINQCLISKQFIQQVHPYMNSVLTSTNIGIILKTLEIYLIFPTKKLKYQALQRIKSAVNICTMHQLEKNITSLQCNLQYLNNILAKIGLIATQEQYKFYVKYIWKITKNANTFEAENQKNLYSYQSSNLVDYKSQGQLQIYEILDFVIESQEIEECKRQLLIWLESQEYAKKMRAKKRQEERRNKKSGKISYTNKFNLSQAKNCKKLGKIKVKFMKSHELLNEMMQQELIIKPSLLSITYLNNCSTHQLKYCFIPKNQTDSKQDKIDKYRKVELSNLNVFPSNNQNRESIDSQNYKKKLLNGGFIEEQIMDQLKNGKSIIINNFDPNSLQISSTTTSTYKFIEEISQGIITNQFLSTNRRIINEPFFRIANKIFK